ncbi:MAG TPA: lipid II flippase MurJ, partial [Candidatus Babeliales bacterium]|nr:lipid II flippase MurJ [Candidatus Babeliales bacterium]
LKNMPVTLIGVAIASAVFPKFSQRVAEHRTDLLKLQVVRTTQVMLWLLLPTAALFVVMRGYIVRLLFGFGDPTTASILGWFAGAIIFQSLMRIVARVFYAEQDTRTPLYTSMIALTINVPLAITLTNFYGIRGLAMAQSLVAILEVSLLYTLMRRRFGRFFNWQFAAHLAKTLLATSAAALAAYLMVRYPFPLVAGETGFTSLAPKFFAIGSVGAVAYIATGWLLKLPEATTVTSRIGRVIFKRLQIQ